MTTGRQQIIASLSLKVADRMFENWRNTQSDPMTESDLYQFCQDTGAEYAPKIPSITDIIDMIEEFALDRKRGDMTTDWHYIHDKAKTYYIDATDNAIKRLAIAIDREAAKRCRQMIDRYDVKKLVEEHKAQEEQKPVNENIGKRVFCEAVYNPAENRYADEGYGTVVDVDKTGYLFQVRLDADDDLYWHDSRTVRIAKPVSNYAVEVTVTFKRTIQVTAQNDEEAFEKVSDMRASDIVNLFGDLPVVEVQSVKINDQS